MGQLSNATIHHCFSYHFMMWICERQSCFHTRFKSRKFLHALLKEYEEPACEERNTDSAHEKDLKSDTGKWSVQVGSQMQIANCRIKMICGW